MQCLFRKRANIQIARGNDDQITTYLKKENKYEIWGKPSKQGERTDLKRLADAISQEEETCNSILRSNPYAIHIYGRVLEKIEARVKRARFRDFQTEGKWFYGSTGTGKSYEAFRGYTPETHYRKPLDEKDVGWWDAYEGQKVVILDEFRGQLSFDRLLVLCDKYPYDVSQRCKEPTQFVSTEVRITSCYRPEDIYKKETLETLEQFYRRFKVIKMIWKKGYSVCIENVVTPIRCIDGVTEFYEMFNSF